MAIDLAKLAAQGRAKSSAAPWSPEELDAVLALVRERNLTMVEAAEQVRNGITTADAYDAATEAGFKPKSIEEAHKEAEATLAAAGAQFGAAEKPKAKRTK